MIIKFVRDRQNKAARGVRKESLLFFWLAVYSQYMRILNLNSQNSHTGQPHDELGLLCIVTKIRECLARLGTFTRCDGRLDEPQGRLDLRIFGSLPPSFLFCIQFCFHVQCIVNSRPALFRQIVLGRHSIDKQKLLKADGNTRRMRDGVMGRSAMGLFSALSRWTNNRCSLHTRSKIQHVVITKGNCCASQKGRLSKTAFARFLSSSGTMDFHFTIDRV